MSEYDLDFDEITIDSSAESFGEYDEKMAVTAWTRGVTQSVRVESVYWPEIQPPIGWRLYRENSAEPACARTWESLKEAVQAARDMAVEEVERVLYAEREVDIYISESLGLPPRPLREPDAE